jgi:DNA repair exonuclease SbcCD ATPase subunit
VERQHPLTYEEVCEAANALHHQGRHVTIDALHSLLGRGSKTTIHKHRERWRLEIQHANKDAQLRSPLAPDPLKQFFETTFSTLWRAALEAANETLAELRDEADRAVAKAKEEVQKAIEEADSARRESAMLATRAATLDDKLERSLRELGDEREKRATQEVKANANARAAAERIATLSAALTKADAREAELTAYMQSAMKELEDQLAKAKQGQAETERQAHIALQAMQREAENQEHALRRALKLAQNRVKVVSAAWRTKERSWIEVKSKLQGKLEAEVKESSRLVTALAREESHRKQLEERTHMLDREWVDLEKTVTALRGQLSEAHHQLARLEPRLQTLLGDNARLNEKLSHMTNKGKHTE